MRLVIEDTWFPACMKLHIGPGGDELWFRRCSFEGGEIFIEEGVDRTIFADCVFQQTRFSGQPLSERIATRCRNALVQTEAAEMGPASASQRKFRR